MASLYIYICKFLIYFHWATFPVQIGGFIVFCHCNVLYKYKIIILRNLNICMAIGVKAFVEMISVSSWNYLWEDRSIIWIQFIYILYFIIDICYCRNTRGSAVGRRTLWDSERASYDTSGKWAFQKEPLLFKCSINDLISTAKSLILIHKELELCSQRKVEAYPFIWGFGDHPQRPGRLLRKQSPPFPALSDGIDGITFPR